jgi:SAM-dependent methyltransferase
MHDSATLRYFDSLTPEYSTTRYAHIVEMINRYCPGAGASLIDIGCGNGNILQLIRDSTPVEKLVGMDVSENYLAQAKQRLECGTVLGSILDDNAIASIADDFDFAVMGSVLHHLVGGTRSQSRELAKRAICNALRLLKDSGHLLVFEPTFCPSLLMDVVFFTKSFVARTASGRIELFASWANIGPPVVSFYTSEQLVELIDQITEAQLVDKEITDRRRLAFIIRSTQTTLVVRRA